MLTSLSLFELPAPITDFAGWPWQLEVNNLPPQVSDKIQWPRLSVVTPSFNQASFLEETIRSVLLQNYPNLEYIVIDGGSTDGSVEIIRRYEPWLAYWVSEPDRGQAHAINKGLARSTGQILAWLNSDDTYLPDTLWKITKLYQQKPDTQLVYGSAIFTDESGTHTNLYSGQPLKAGLDRMKYWLGWPIPQPTVFFSRDLLVRYSTLDETYRYALDYEWLIRLSQYVEFVCLPDVLATYRLHGQSKTGNWEKNKILFFAECQRANRRYAPWHLPNSWPLWLADLRNRFAAQ